MKRLVPATLLVAGLALAPLAQATTLLNASYDVMRDFYKEYNGAFLKHWQAEGGEPLQINMSHGGSSKQARAVIDGLPADVITMNMATDINALADHGGLVPQDWAARLPDNSAPFTSATVFIVRKGNPKNIRDWSDLAREDVAPVFPNPKTSGNGRYTYLAAYAYALAQNFWLTHDFKNRHAQQHGGQITVTPVCHKSHCFHGPCGTVLRRPVAQHEPYVGCAGAFLGFTRKHAFWQCGKFGKAAGGSFGFF